MKNFVIRSGLLLCMLGIACEQTDLVESEGTISSFQPEVNIDGLTPSYVLYRSSLPGPDVMDVIARSSSISLVRLVEISPRVNAIGRALSASGASNPTTPENEFFEGAAKFLPHLIADFDFSEGYFSDVCLGQCSSPKKTEIDEFRGKGIYIIDTLIDVRKTKLPDFSITLNFGNFDSIAQAKIDQWAKLGALEVIKNADATGQYQNDSEKEDFLVFLEASIAKKAYQYCTSKLKKHSESNVSAPSENSKVAIKLPNVYEISNVYLGVYHAKSAAEMNSRREVGRVYLGFRTIAYE